MRSYVIRSDFLLLRTNVALLLTPRSELGEETGRVSVSPSLLSRIMSGAGASQGAFNHQQLPSSVGKEGPYEFTSTAGRHVQGNLRGFWYAEEERSASRNVAGNRTGGVQRRRRDL